MGILDRMRNVLLEGPYVLQIVDVEEDRDTGYKEQQLPLDRRALVLACTPDCHRAQEARRVRRDHGRRRRWGVGQ